MVGPAVKREAVAQLRAVMGLSERRACSIVGVDRKTARYSPRRRTQNCARRCAILPTSAGALAIGGCSFCRGKRARPRARTASTGSTARRG